MTKEIKLRLHNTAFRATLKHGSENSNLKQRSGKRLTGEQIKFLRALIGLTTLKTIINTEIKAKDKGKIHPRTGHEGPEGE